MNQEQFFEENLKKDFLRWTRSQERQLHDWIRDCIDWDEIEFLTDIQNQIQNFNQIPEKWNLPQKRNWLFGEIRNIYNSYADRPRKYAPGSHGESPGPFHIVKGELKSEIYRRCPAASEKGICCDLQTLNIVDNCTLGCTYCFLQNHKGEKEVKFPTNLRERLESLEIDPNKRVRIGTGEYSDSLLWGNRDGILEDLCNFAKKHPNIILELKTKTANISWLLENDVPANVCCSWSLNPQVVIDNEEPGSVSLEQRFEAARKVADKGIAIAFHIHPMIWYEGWEEGYRSLIQRIRKDFVPAEILWFSMGSITWIRGMPHVLRNNLRKTKALQMPTEVTPDNKITYSFEIREKMYSLALEEWGTWKNDVWTYLCMEFPPMWQKVLGKTYATMEEHAEDFNNSAFAKLKF